MNLLTDRMRILEALPIGLLVVNDSGDIRVINSAAATMLGLDETAVAALQSGVCRQEFIGLIDDSYRDDWSRLLGTIDVAATNDQWQQINSAKGMVPVRVTPGQVHDGLVTHIIVVLDSEPRSPSKGTTDSNRKLLHEMNNCLAVATTNAELIGINLDRNDYPKLATNSRLITDNLFRLAGLFRESIGSPDSH